MSDADRLVQPVRIEFIDFAKGYAIFTVILYHLMQRAALHGPVAQAIVFGGTGIHLFFLLSGFGLVYASKPLNALDFYRRRLVKVWWPYVLALTLSLIAALAFDIFPDRWGAWLAGVGLYQMFIEPYIQSFGGHFWFISAIIQFYLVFPVIRYVQQRLDEKFFPVMLLLSVFWWTTVFVLDKGEWRTWNSFFLQYIWEFALGMQMAVWLRTGKKPGAIFWEWPLGRQLLLGVLFTAMMIAMIVKLGPSGRVFNDVPALFGYSLICAGIYQICNIFIPVLKRFFLWINGFSYSLYLVHILALEFYLRIVPFDGIGGLLLYVPVGLLCGVGFEWLSKWWGKIPQRFL